MCSPAQGAHDMTEARYSREGRVEGRTANGVENHLESLAGGMSIDVVRHSILRIVDERSPEPFDSVPVPLRARGKYLGSQGQGKLNGDVPYTARSTVDQHSLVGLNGGSIHEPFPGGDE